MASSKVEICGVETSTLPVLTNERMRELFPLVHGGDRAAREEFIRGNLRLVLSVVQRFSNRGENADDLFQVGCIGLIKALDNFDVTQNVRFSTYAVPMIIGEIRRYLRDNNPIRVSRSHIQLEIGKTRIVARLLEGEFIRYRQILPDEWQTRISVSRAELGSAIDRASLIAREGKNNLVCFKIDGEELQVTSNSESGDVEERIAIATEGKDLTIAFNVRYITDVLKALSDDEVYMRFNSNVSPCVICPIQGDAYLYLVLPVRVFGA